jgi:hypothetical protein
LRLRAFRQHRAAARAAIDLLQRTGFDAVQLRHDQSVEAAVRALGYFGGHYQGDLQQPKPAFARDLAAEIAPAHDPQLLARQGIRG